MKVVLIPVLLAVLACAETTEPDFGGMPVHGVFFTAPLELSFRATVKSDTFYVLAEVRNPNATAATMNYGACSFAVRAVSATGSVWDNRLPPNTACIEPLYSLDVAPGQVVSEPVIAQPVTTLLARVPQAQYDVKVYIRVDESLREYSAGSVALTGST